MILEDQQQSELEILTTTHSITRGSVNVRSFILAFALPSPPAFQRWIPTGCYYQLFGRCGVIGISISQQKITRWRLKTFNFLLWIRRGLFSIEVRARMLFCFLIRSKGPTAPDGTWSIVHPYLARSVLEVDYYSRCTFRLSLYVFSHDSHVSSCLHARISVLT